MKPRVVVISLLAVVLLLSVACSGRSPEQQAARAAQRYYECLAEGRIAHFLKGKVGADSMPAAYREQLQQAVGQYLSDLQRSHGGLRAVRISDNAARRDTTLQLTYAFLVLSFADSTQEEIAVPMVQAGDRWFMR